MDFCYFLFLKNADLETKAFMEWHGTDVPSRLSCSKNVNCFFFGRAVVSKFWEGKKKSSLRLPLRLLFRSTSPSLLFVFSSEKKRTREHKSHTIIMATDEELEAKKVNDTTPTDKAPEQPEKKKKDVATAILERKKAPNRLVVGEFFFDFSFFSEISFSR
jgi:hypothetical protein